MEAIVLCGLQGAGKTTLYRDRWLETAAPPVEAIGVGGAAAADTLADCVGTG